MPTLPSIRTIEPYDFTRTDVVKVTDPMTGATVPTSSFWIEEIECNTRALEETAADEFVRV